MRQRRRNRGSLTKRLAAFERTTPTSCCTISTRTVAGLERRQHDDGGWSLEELGEWRWDRDTAPFRSPGTRDPALAARSDGYATGLIAYTLRQAGLSASARTAFASFGETSLKRRRRDGGSGPAAGGPNKVRPTSSVCLARPRPAAASARAQDLYIENAADAGPRMSQPCTGCPSSRSRCCGVNTTRPDSARLSRTP